MTSACRLSPARQTSAHRTSPVRQTPSATTPPDVRQTTAPACRPSPDRHLSTSSGTVTEEPQQDTTLVDPSPELFESTGLTVETFLGFEDSRAEVSSQTLEKSPELRTSEAPRAAAPQDGEVVPRTSVGLASGIGSFFRPDLLQDSSEDDEVEVQQPAVSTSLSAQMQLVADVQEGQDPSNIQRVNNLAAEMNVSQDSFRVVVGSRLDAIERTMDKMANGLLEMQKAHADSAAEIQKTRREDHRETMDILQILAQSINRLVKNTSCLAHSNDNMSVSHRHSASSQQIIATTLQMTYDKLPEPAHEHAGDPPLPPSRATWTPPPTSWYRRSQMYQGYTGMYPTHQMPPPPTPAATSTAAWAPRPSQPTTQPPRTSTPHQEEEEDPDRHPP
ncbi:uncharacterized protein LOC134936100 [Pseudophryne corroboree]|uniref:uncharacterized protein LOC134936100 n=1 Tax=Pseudophryne corroboree TaxID=495146 RepID=UPI003081EDF3